MIKGDSETTIEDYYSLIKLEDLLKLKTHLDIINYNKNFSRYKTVEHYILLRKLEKL